MIISDTAIRQRISVMVLALIILIGGIYSYLALPRESAPDIPIPHVFVSTSYRGVSPEDIETSITIPIEKRLKGLEDVKKITSMSSEGLSSINIEFITGTDIDDVLQKVRDKVDAARGDLPSDLEEDPTVFEVNISEFPVIVLSLSGSIGEIRLKEIAEDLKDSIESIPGVLETEISGGLEREIRIELCPERLAYYGLPLTALQQVIGGENQNVSGGTFRLGDGRFQLRVPGEFPTPEEMNNLVVGICHGSPVYLRDVARVIDGFKEQTSRSRLNGRSAVNLTIKKRSGENIIVIADEIDALLKRLEPTWPKGTTITKLMDQSEDIRAMVADLENNLLSGLLLVLAVILLFMGLRNAVMVGLAIPFSMFLSFITLHALGITLNMVVLFSLTLALGMLVDNAIVIIENVYRYMQQGVPRMQAAMKATSEVAYPVIGSTLTTVAAFFPMLFWPGIMGEFMKYLPITLIITLLSSLFVAMVINPALASMFMKAGKVHHPEDDPPASAEEIQLAGESPVVPEGVVLRTYQYVLRKALDHRMAVIMASFAVLFIFLQLWLLLVGLEKPIEFFPNIDPKSLYINIDLPEGADLDYADRLNKRIEARVGDISSNIEYIYSRGMAATEEEGMAFSMNTPSHVGVQFVSLEERPVPSYLTVDQIRQRVQDIPGARIVVDIAQEGPPTGAPINIEIVGDDYRISGRLAKQIREIISRIPFVQDIRDDYVEGSPSIQVTVDRQKAALVGLSTNLIGFALKSALNGVQVSTYYEADEDFDITIQLPESERRSIDVLKQLLLTNATGQLIPLTTVAAIDYTGSVGRISRVDHERVVTIRANVDEEKIPGPVARGQAEELLAHFPLPPGYRIRFTGEFEIQQEAQDFLSKAFVVALFLIFLVLVTQFNSISQPFIIMTSVILSLGGVFLGLSVFRYSFGIIMTGVGVISLAGVVVNNAIVLIDYINQLRQRGWDRREAIVAAGCTRLRPVFLTAITTILGLVPMITGVAFDFHQWQITWVSESSQWWRSMAVAVVFGLSLATILTLVVVPVLYSFFDSAKTRLSRLGTRFQ
ncbi:MAG: efflux RND transporter permease subunit [bacterium]